MSDRSTSGWRLAVVAIALQAAAEARAELAPIGLSEVRAQWFANVAIGANPAGSFEELGSAVGAGDFDGDGADDLVIGAPTDHGIDGECVMCGAVVVRFGSAGQGLAGGAGPLLLSQEAPASPDPAEPGERFGYAVAAGDFDGDGRDDLAVGVPHDFVGETSVGGVAIYYGVDAAAGGLPTVADLVLHQGADGLPGTAAAGDWFGAALAIGDFDGDGYDDLAIGAHFDGDPGVGSSGSVTVAYGGASGLLPFAGVLLHQGRVAMADDAESNDAFGAALVTGDFDGNGFEDLIASHPNENTSVFREGALTAMMGGAGGLISRFRFVAGTLVGLPSGGNQHAGRALAVGDFDGSGFSDLGVGVPFNDVGGSNAGAAFVLYGALFADGFELGTVQRWSTSGN
jgi:hypothetical protein